MHISHTCKLLLWAVIVVSISACGGDENVSSHTDHQYVISLSASTGGTIYPSFITVNKGEIVHFTVIPDDGYSIESIVGCDSSPIGDAYATTDIHENCSVKASFSLNTYTVSTHTTSGGNISPEVRTINYGETAQFTVIANNGYSISNVSGCDGNLIGDVYTTGKIVANCTVKTLSAIDSTAPVAHISFPPPKSLTEGRMITVRGTATDVSEITAVHVNGQNAVTTDNYSNWSASISLDQGLNHLVIGTLDNAGNYNKSAAQAKIYSQGISFISIQSITLDQKNNRVLLVDASLDAVVAVDLVTGVREIISNRSTPNAATPLSYPVDLVLDSLNNRVLVLDWVLDAVVAVDLNTGVRTNISSPSFPDEKNSLSIPRKLVLDKTNNRVLVLDTGLNAIVAIDLTSGVRTIVTYEIPDGVLGSRGLELDSVNNRLLVGSPEYDAVITIDLNTGINSVLTDSIIPDSNNALSHPVDIVLDSVNNRVLILDWKLNSLIAVDLITRIRTIISDKLIFEAMNTAEGLKGMVLDSNQNRVLVVAAGLDAIVAVDLTTGKQSTISSNLIPNELNSSSDFRLNTPIDLALDQANSRVLVIDQYTDSILSVNLKTGARTLISDDPFSIFVSLPESLVLDSTLNRVLVTDEFRGEIIAVNLSTGTGTVLSSPSTPGATPSLSSPRDLTLDSTNNRILVVDSDLDAVVAVDLTTGVHTIISDSITPNAINAWSWPSSLELDSTNNRVLVLDTELASVTAVDLIDGTRTVISDPIHPDSTNVLTDPVDIALDSINNRVLVLDAYLSDAVISVDLDSGMRTIVSDAITPDQNNALINPSSLVLDSVNNVVLVSDVTLQAILAIDLMTGQRVFLSR